MIFEEAISVLKEGKSVRRRAWSNKYNNEYFEKPPKTSRFPQKVYKEWDGKRGKSKSSNVYLYFSKLGCLWKRIPHGRYTQSELCVLCLDDLNADDWEVIR